MESIWELVKFYRDKNIALGMLFSVVSWKICFPLKDWVWYDNSENVTSFKVSDEPSTLPTFPLKSPASQVYQQSSFLDTRGCIPSYCVELFITLREAIYNFVKLGENIVTNNGCLVREFQMQLKAVLK